MKNKNFVFNNFYTHWDKAKEVRWGSQMSALMCAQVSKMTIQMVKYNYCLTMVCQSWKTVASRELKVEQRLASLLVKCHEAMLRRTFNPLVERSNRSRPTTNS